MAEKIYNCKKCKYSTTDKRDYTKHMTTKKHMRKVGKIKKAISPTCANKMFVCAKCNKSYKYRSGLSRHLKKCDFDEDDEFEVVPKKKEAKEGEEEYGVLINIIKEQQKQLNETHKLLEKTIESNNEMIPKIGNNNNNKISINVFLNEQCKGAMNLTDFVDKLTISVEDLIYTKQHGYIQGVTNLFNKQLRDLNPSERPIHCSDKKRLQFYVKEDNKWEKDADHLKIDKSIHDLKMKQIKELKKWEEINPNYLENEQLLNEWQTLVHQIMGDENDEDREKNNQLIKKNIANNIPIKEAITIK